MKYLISCIVLFMGLFGASVEADAATYYVRPLGGDATQCKGNANVDYPGSGTDQDCAWKHPSWALGVSVGAQPRISGGDTLIIANGSYSIGYGAPNSDQGGCSTLFAYDCYPRAIPAGTSGAPTRILGEGWNTGCKVKPELWATQRNNVLNLIGSNWTQVSCLEITDHSPCIENHWQAQYRCARDNYPHGTWGSIGIMAHSASNVTLTDLDIHGMASTGINAGFIQNWTVERTRITANGSSGWNGDYAGIPSSDNSGNFVFRDVEISWNGCSENYPSLAIVACWGQQNGGYGDGFGLASSAGTWLFEDSSVHHNSSDGLDLLYLQQSASTTFRRVKAFANAGNQLKASGTVLIENSYVYGYCQYFFGRYGGAMGIGDSCRANGNALSINIPTTNAGVRATIRYSTISGTGDCLVLLSGKNPTSTIVNIENSVFVGQTDWYADRSGSPGEKSCFEYSSEIVGEETLATINYRNNIVYNVKPDATQCPAGSTCTNPNLRNQSPDKFDGRPLSTSVARNSGNTTYTTPATDIDGRPRPQETNPTRGAFEYKP